MKKPVSIGLGTVQLGLPYGIRANEPLMSNEEVHSILTYAVDSGIRFFDTASCYGEAEKRLGEFCLTKSGSELEVSSKIMTVKDSVYSNEDSYRSFVFKEAKESLKKLGLKRFRLLQFHQSDIRFLKVKHVEKIMRELIDLGICESIGISVYHPDEAIAALELKPVTAIQVPLNILDRRFISQELIELYERKNARVIARSVFWQGILTSGTGLPKVKKEKSLLEFKLKAQKIAEEFSLPLETLSLGYVFSEVKGISVGLVGVDSIASLKANLDLINYTRRNAMQDISLAFADLSKEAEARGILNPHEWDFE